MDSQAPDSPDAVGLCATCVHCRVVPAARSTFYLCARSQTDDRFPRYPVLPVLRCPGYERAADAPRKAGGAMF